MKTTHGRHNAVTMCREWCNRLQHFLDTFVDGGAVWEVDWTASAGAIVETVAFQELARTATGPTLNRVKELRRIAPTN